MNAKRLAVSVCCIFFKSLERWISPECIPVCIFKKLSALIPFLVGDVPKSQQRLHTIGVEIVGQLMWQLNMKTATGSAHSSPQGEEARPSESCMITESAEEHPADELVDGMIISENSHEIDSDAMDISNSKQTVAARHFIDSRRKEETIEETSSVKGSAERHSMDISVNQAEAKRGHKEPAENVHEGSPMSPEVQCDTTVLFEVCVPGIRFARVHVCRLCLGPISGNSPERRGKPRHRNSISQCVGTGD